MFQPRNVAPARSLGSRLPRCKPARKAGHGNMARGLAAGEPGGESGTGRGRCYRGAGQEAGRCWAISPAALGTAVERSVGWSCWWVDGCLCGGTWGPREIPVLAVVCEVPVACPSPDADQAVSISFWSLKLAAFPQSVTASAWQEPCRMFRSHPVHVQVVNARHCDGLAAAEACAWGRETLNRCKKDQVLVHPLLLTPLRGEIMNVPSCGVPHGVLAPEGPREAPRRVVAQERLSSPREQTARHGGCAGRGCPLPTRRCSGGGSGGVEAGARPGCQRAS